MTKVTCQYRHPKTQRFRYVRCCECGERRIFKSWSAAREWCRERGYTSFKVSRL